MQYVPYTEIPERIGLKGNESLWVASDLSRLMLTALKQEKAFRPELLLDAFSAVIPDGTLLIPAFKANFKDGEEIDFKTLKPDTGGLSSTAFKLFRKGDFHRTEDPFHSFFIKGEQSEEFLNASTKNTFGVDSVFAKLEQANGCFLSIDIPLQYSFTFAHYVEEKLTVPYRTHESYRFIINGQPTVCSIYAKKKGYMINLNGLKELFIQEGAAEVFEINAISLLKIDLPASIAVIQNDIENNDARNLITFDRKLWTKQSLKTIIGKDR